MLVKGVMDLKVSIISIFLIFKVNIIVPKPSKITFYYAFPPTVAEIQLAAKKSLQSMLFVCGNEMYFVFIFALWSTT